jgi:hypothetical protein
MIDAILERRHLEQHIRRVEAEEYLLERRLERLEIEQDRTRRAIQARLRDEPWRRLAG